MLPTLETVVETGKGERRRRRGRRGPEIKEGLVQGLLLRLIHAFLGHCWRTERTPHGHALTTWLKNLGEETCASEPASNALGGHGNGKGDEWLSGARGVTRNLPTPCKRASPQVCLAALRKETEDMRA